MMNVLQVQKIVFEAASTKCHISQAVVVVVVVVAAAAAAALLP